MKAIELHGSFYKKNDNGFLVNTTGIERLTTDTKEFLDKIILEYKRVFPNLDSIYLRGSAAEGKFREGVSDIDTFALIEKNLKKSPIRRLKRNICETIQNL
ncbi:MAG: nucleotidyltransferase domain-containing protein [Ignavibacteria bacterium]|nr:nucleotidyltransferase domain-containing protein [Ignavibacteria bacterium]